MVVVLSSAWNRSLLQHRMKGGGGNTTFIQTSASVARPAPGIPGALGERLGEEE